MEVELGTAGLESTHQEPFEPEVDCIQPGCGGRARIGFVASEIGGDKEYVCDLHENRPREYWPNGEGFWLHDACAVVVYFCRKCLNPTAHYNQG